MKHEESKLQQACVKWFRLQYPQHIIFAIPNGGKRGIVTASIMKAEGVLAGVPDLFVAQRALPYCGLFIEMKTDKGKLTQEQELVIDRLRLSGYRVEVCRTFEEFEKTVKAYLK